MAIKDNNDEHLCETDESPDLPHMVKQNSEKINLLESGQKEILTQLRLLVKKLGNQVVNNNDDTEHSFIKVVEMLANT